MASLTKSVPPFLDHEMDERDEAMLAEYGECFVYVIGVDVPGSPQKIGVAQSVDQRRRDLQTGSPLPLVAHYAHRTDRHTAFQTEYYAHYLLKAQRMEGEWFRVTPETAARVIRMAHRRVRRSIRDETPLAALVSPQLAMSLAGLPGRQPGTSPPKRTSRRRPTPTIRSFG